MISKFLNKLKSILFKSSVSSETPLKKSKRQLKHLNPQKPNPKKQMQKKL